MASDVQCKVKAVMDNYRYLAKQNENAWLRWSTKKFDDEAAANAFFIGVMLDQQQRAARAWAGGVNLVEHRFKEGNLWKTIVATDDETIRKICKSGFVNHSEYSGSYSIGMPAGKFPHWLKANAQIICEQYDADVQKIWCVQGPNAINDLHCRFRAFHGIGQALAKMACFLLVRGYGIAGGEKSKCLLKVKPDIHVCRVASRMGLTTNNNIHVVAKEIDALQLASPADFDAVLYLTGKTFCHKTNPDCRQCPLKQVCDHACNSPLTS